MKEFALTIEQVRESKRSMIASHKFKISNHYLDEKDLRKMKNTFIKQEEKNVKKRTDAQLTFELGWYKFLKDDKIHDELIDLYHEMFGRQLELEPAKKLDMICEFLFANYIKFVQTKGWQKGDQTRKT